jgi:hypothetical protein
MDNNTDLSLTLREIGKLLLEKFDIHEGLFDMKVDFQIASGPMGPNPSELVPGLVIAISKVGLLRSTAPNGSTFNAALVNPKKEEVG